jgi:hypothetical protein
MTLPLLESLSKVRSPLIRPSDPKAGHLSYWAFDNAEVVPPELYKRSSYARVGLVMDENRAHHSLGFVQKHLDVPQYKANSSKKRGLYDDSDTEETESSSFDMHKYKKFGIELPDFSKSKLQSKDIDYATDDYRVKLPFSEGHEDIFRRFDTDSFCSNFKQIMTIPDPLVRAAALVGMLCHVDGKNFKFWIDQNVHVPFNIKLWRLFIEHHMSSCVVMQGGNLTGFNVFGNANFALSYDGQTKVIYGNYTCETKAIVHESRFVEVIENIKPDGYVGGRNCLFIGENEFELSQERLRNRPSILSTILPITENKFEFAMSFTGPLPIPELNTSIDGSNSDTYSTARYYENYVWRLGDRSAQYYRLDGNYFTRIGIVNTLAFQGFHACWNEATGVYDKIKECTGHCSKDGSGPGAAPVWNGRAASFPVQERPLSLV